MKHPEYEKIDVPRLDPQVKEMNGKSTRRLKQCISDLECVLADREPEERHEEGSDSPSARADAE